MGNVLRVILGNGLGVDKRERGEMITRAVSSKPQDWTKPRPWRCYFRRNEGTSSFKSKGARVKK